MRILFFAFVQLLPVLTSFCQAPQWKKPKYLARIEDKSENFILSGALYNITDSSVVLTCSTCKVSETERFQVQVPIRKMDEIIIQRNSHINNWLMAGSASGAAGFTYAYLKYRDTENEFSYQTLLFPAAFFTLGMLPFVATGIIKGALPGTRIIIDKESGKFSANKDILKKYCFIQ